MIKHVWSVICQKSVIDQESNNISLIDVLEKIDVNVNKIPSREAKKIDYFNVPIKYEIVTLWFKDNQNSTSSKETIQTKIVLTNFKGEKIKEMKKEITIPKNKTRLRDITKIQNIPVKKSGLYTYQILTKSKQKEKYHQIATLPIEVEVNLP